MKRLRFWIFLLKIQWIDRAATSAFLMGLTLQTALMVVAIFERSLIGREPLEFATKGTLLTTVGIALFGAMSSVQNEFRYGTIESVLLSRVSLFRLMMIRSACTAIVSAPAVLIPFAAVFIRFPETLGIASLVLIVAVFVTVIAIGLQSALLLNVTDVPSVYLPWLKALLLILGFGLIRFPGADQASLFFPSGWCLKIAHEGEVVNIAYLVGGLVLSAVFSCAIPYAILKRRVQAHVERQLTSGRMGA